MFQAIGCNYLMVQSISEVSMSDFDNCKAHKCFIVHMDDKVFSLNNVSVDSINVSGTFGTMESGFYRDDLKKYRENEVEVLNEIHIYTLGSSDYVRENGDIIFPLKDIKEVRIIKEDVQRNRTNSILATVLIVGAISAVLILAIFNGGGDVAVVM